MKPLSPSDLTDLYLYAQLVADDAEEATELLTAALDARDQGDRREPDEVIRSIVGPALNESGAWLARRQVPTALEEMLPRLMARLRPSRRLSIVKAFKNTEAEDSDQSVFYISVKRALESDGLHSVADRLTMDALQESMRRYIDSRMAPVPEHIQEAWEQRMRPPADRPVRNTRRFPLSARIAAGVLVILLSAAIGSWLSAPSTNAPSMQSELFDELSGMDAGDPGFRAGDPEQAERFLADRLNWQLSVPRLREGSIVGVSIAELQSDLAFPVLHYRDQANGADLRVLVVDYRFLDRAGNTYLIDSRILDQIADTGSIDIRNAPDFFRVTWRFRDDIYVALAKNPDPDLRNRFLFDQ